MTAEAADQTATHRPYLQAVAYRMLGSWADAEDIVQEAFARYVQVDTAAVDAPRAYLTTVVTRLCLDRLKSARSRRERYVGMWLPEPVPGDDRGVSGAGADSRGPDDALQRAQDVSFALLVVLERLSPLERAAFLLHDVFGQPFAEVSRTLGRGEAACRKLATRARSQVRSERPRFEPDAESQRALTEAFFAASQAGDARALSRMLADNAVVYSDGGGKRVTARRPIHGRDDVVRFLCGIARRWPQRQPGTVTTINGGPGAVTRDADGALSAVCLDIRDGRVAAVYISRNPEKLGAITARFGADSACD